MTKSLTKGIMFKLSINLDFNLDLPRLENNFNKKGSDKSWGRYEKHKKCVKLLCQTRKKMILISKKFSTTKNTGKP